MGLFFWSGKMMIIFTVSPVMVKISDRLQQNWSHSLWIRSWHGHSSIAMAIIFSGWTFNELPAILWRLAAEFFSLHLGSFNNHFTFLDPVTKMIYMSDTQLHLGSYILLTFLDSSASRCSFLQELSDRWSWRGGSHSKPRNAWHGASKNCLFHVTFNT